MRAINHALTGAFIGLSVSEPLAAMPLALASHYVLDVIPHYDEGVGKSDRAWLKSKLFTRLLVGDAIACFVLVFILAITRPSHWWLAAVCAFVASAPDFLSINKFIRVLKRRQWKPGLYSKFASGIQWFQRPIGLVVEVAWFGAMVTFLLPYFGIY